MPVRAPFRRLHTALLGGLAAVLLTACGGGGDLVEPFRAQRLFVFGDESNVIVSGSTATRNGLRHTVNLRLGDGTVDCLANGLWVQRLGRELGFGFPACPLPVGEEAAPRGRILATAGSGLAGLEAQISAHLSATPPAAGDLATIYSGQKDVLDLYQTSSLLMSDSAKLTAARSAGRRLADQVIRLDALNIRVLFGTLPNQALTPLGRAESTAGQALLRDMSEQFNIGAAERLDEARISGTRVGQVDVANRIGLLALDADNLGDGGNVSAAACTSALPDCDTTTLVAGATATNYLWADDRHFGARGHEVIGLRAIDAVQDRFVR